MLYIFSELWHKSKVSTAYFHMNSSTLVREYWLWKSSNWRGFCKRKNDNVDEENNIHNALDEAGQQEGCGEIEEQAATLPGDKYQPLMLVSFLIVKRKHIYIFYNQYARYRGFGTRKGSFHMSKRKQMSVLEGDIFVQGKDPRIWMPREKDG